jgi:predicted nucleic acid-binding protein
MVIVDSSVLIDHLLNNRNPQTSWLRQYRDMQRLGITSLVFCEVLQGIRGEARFIRAQEELSQFEMFETGSRALALASARNYRALRGFGFTVRTTIDCMIATFCIEEGHMLLHNDRDFDAFEAHLGLQVLRPQGSLRH